MGVIVDTSTLVTAERQKRTVREVFLQLRDILGETAVGLSAVTLTELAHGIERAKLEAHRKHRQAFLDDLIADIKIYPVTAAIAQLAGRISGQQAHEGNVLPFEDLLIGATALHYGFEVVTENTKHFEMIPDLVVKKI
jgi:predicted nucleic acid-binding protein